MEEPTQFDRSIVGLAGLVVSDNADVRAALSAVAELARAAIDGCVAASVTLVAHRGPITAAFAGQTARDLDQAQYDSLLGPCLEALRDDRPVRLGATADVSRWAGYALAARRAGIEASLSVPLHLNDRAIGSLNLYGADPDAFDDHDEGLTLLFATHADAVVANTDAYWSALLVTRQLTAAMTSRAVIEQARGIVMAAERCGPDVAFDIMRDRAQNEGETLRDVAAVIVDRRTTS